jgi:hypothetical protein
MSDSEDFDHFCEEASCSALLLYIIFYIANNWVNMQHNTHHTNN